MAGFASALDRTPLPQRKAFIEKAKQLKIDGNENYRKFLEEYKKPTDQRNGAILEKLQKDAKRSYHLAHLQAQAAYPFNADSFKKEEAHKLGKDEGASTSAAAVAADKEDEPGAIQNECYELIASIYNNLAAVILAYPEGQKNDDYARAVEYCSNVLLIQKDNAKAMYRKAQALERMGHLRRALTFYRDADLVEKHQNVAVQRDLTRLQTQVAEAKKQSQDEFKDNFQRGISKSGLAVSSDATEYGKPKDKDTKKKKKKGKQYAESPSRGSSCSPSTSSDSGSSSSGRSSDE